MFVTILFDIKGEPKVAAQEMPLVRGRGLITYESDVRYCDVRTTWALVAPEKHTIKRACEVKSIRAVVLVDFTIPALEAKPPRIQAM